ncbi:M20/M25/M40 family metallo-hydrolase [Pseudoteredinibacter isoporae]|uniref:Glutamate carboxypeptidase n=1 Tax=Pseudoteredinibacter isoporae TaxID=570281 RepID=A0A7X0MYW6_9GAMM|nr:M20/M25/M40 family metallo-hydrolase [Pseudoteredinibacter isoporae]MBB6522497.1 glutamate carboxypeptidase [Pseudoteredinibacter isoporae]NHO88026.1 M20 family metallopeptidase [Pseudoteredinibacter isoporae]NIB23643.1 M20 family metallopeptidase [Pseudoteredinibacter isoporae]
MNPLGWKRLLTGSFLLASLLQAGLSHAELTTIEKNIVQRANQQLPQALEELKTAVNINSGTMNFTGVEKVGRLYQQQFDELGFKTEWISGKDFNRAGHLQASYGERGPKILMIGHLDTVFTKDDSFQAYRDLGDGKVAGPGITDMKGGNTIVVAALRALKAEGLLKDLQVRVLFTGDEESSGRPLSLSKKAIIDGAKWADIALGFEDGDSSIKTAVIARRGSIGWRLEVSGRPAHSSQVFTDEVGYGAAYEVARILNDFRQQIDGLGAATVNPGLLVAGNEALKLDVSNAAAMAGKSNIVAQTAMVKGDLRTLSPKELAQAQATMKKIVQKNLKHTSATLTFAEGYPPMPPTDANRKLLTQYSQISEDLNYGPVAPVNPRKAGAADISFAADHVDMALDGLGLMGSGGHTRDEVADMDSFTKNIHKAAILMHRLAKQYKH